MRVAERLLAHAAACRGRGRRRLGGVGQIVQRRPGSRPATRRTAAPSTSSLLISSSSTIRPCFVSTRNILPGCSRPLCSDVLGRNVEHADFGGHDDQVVLGDVVARRAQAVAVEHRADDRAVGERDRRRAVPRLHQAGVIFVERLQVRVHQLVVLPRLRESASASRAAAIGRSCTSNSSTLSNVAESLPPSVRIGKHLLAARRRRLRTASEPSRARIQLMLPRSVLISPLWAR